MIFCGKSYGAAIEFTYGFLDAMPHPVCLSSDQLAIVRDCVKRLPRERQHSFVDALIDYLWPHDVILKEHVEDAVRVIIARYLIKEPT